MNELEVLKVNLKVLHNERERVRRMWEPGPLPKSAEQYDRELRGAIAWTERRVNEVQPRTEDYT